MTGTPGNPLRLLLRRGVEASAVALLVGQLVSLAQTLLLARLLGPAEVGVYTAGTVLVGVLVTFSDGGTRAALVQGAEADLEQAANTGFWSTLVVGIGTGFLIVVVSPAVAAIVGDPRAGLVCAATSGAPVLHALAVVPDALLQRRFEFRRRRLLVDPGVSIGFAVVAVVACVMGLGIWGLVAGLYASLVVLVAGVWTLARWRPGAAGPSWRTWRRIARYGAPIAVSGFVDRTRAFAETAIVGRLLGAAPLGLYRYGRRVGELWGRGLAEIGDYVLLPAFARLAAEPYRLRRGFLRALRLVWTGSLPVAALLATSGTPVIVLLLGQRWRGAGIVVETMAGWGPGAVLASVAVAALNATGHTRKLHRLTATSLVLAVGLLVVLTPTMGLAGVGLTMTVERLTTGGYALIVVRRVVGVGGRELLGALAPPLLAAATATATGVALEHAVLHAAAARPAPAVVLVLLEVLVVCAVYLATLAVVAPRMRLDAVVALRALAAHRRRDRGERAVLWVSTARATRGGSASYVAVMAAGPLWARWRIRHVASHVEGARWRTAGVFVVAWTRVAWTMARGRVALLHLHTASRGSFARKAALLWTAVLLRVPVVMHIHGGGFGAFHDACPRLLRRLIRLTLERAARVVVLGPSWSTTLARIAPRARPAVVGNPVEPAPPGCPHDRPLVVCLGRIGPSKGTFELLEAWAELGADRGDAHLVVIGDGMLEAARARAAADDLSGTVTVRDWSPRAEVLATLDTAAVLVLPSRAEGQPMVVLEAMARGVCVVATAVGGVPDVVRDGETGVLVPPGDRAALRRAVGRVLADLVERARLGRSGRELVRAEHDPRVVASALDDLYGELLPGRTTVALSG